MKGPLQDPIAQLCDSKSKSYTSECSVH